MPLAGMARMQNFWEKQTTYLTSKTWQLLRGHRDKTQNRDIYRIYIIYRGKDPPKTTVHGTRYFRRSIISEIVHELAIPECHLLIL